MFRDMKSKVDQLPAADNWLYLPFFLLVFLASTFIVPNSLDIYFLGKQLLLCITAIYAGTALLFLRKRKETKVMRRELLVVSAFAIFSLSFILSGIFSNTNLERLIWGNLGRANGFATILSLTIIGIFIFLAYDEVLEIKCFRFAALYAKAHAILMLIQYFDGNFIYLNKTYGPVIGLLGNPNFSSALMGILIPFLAPSILKLEFKAQEIFWAGLGLVAIWVSNSYAGYAGPIITLLYVVITYSSRFKAMWLRVTTLFFIGSVGIVVGLSILNLGPLAPFIYKSSIGIRRHYFESSLSVFAEAPVFGVGTDSFGDFFRKFRSPEVIELIGDGTTTNDAHNYFLNTLATSGLFTVIPLLVLLVLWAITLSKFLFQSSNKSSIKISIALASLIYIAQSSFTVHTLGVSLFGVIFVSGVLSGNSFRSIGLPKIISNRENFSRFRIPQYSIALVLSIALTLQFFNRIDNDRQAFKILSVEKKYDVEEFKFGIYNSLLPTLEFWIEEPTRSGLLIEELIRMGASLDAEMMARRAFEASPKSRDALWTLIAVLDSIGKVDEAIVYRELLIEREPSSLILYLEQIEDLVLEGELLRAREVLENMESQSRFDFDGLIERARGVLSQ